MDELTSIQATEAAAVAKLAAAPTIQSIEGVPILLMPEGWISVARPDLLPTPARKTGTIETHDVDSFIAVAKRHGSLSDCTIYLDVDYVASRIQATAVFNDHGADTPGWRDHRATLTPRLSEEWKRWTSNDRKTMEQVKLAHFFEENIADFAALEKMPSGGDVLTFVAGLQETRKVKYGSAVNLQNGMVQIEFIEDGDSTTKGKLEMFKQFALGIRPFANGAPYQVHAFLRYRIDRNTGQITFWYELQRADRVTEDASKALIDTIIAGTGLPVIFGKA